MMPAPAPTPPPEPAPMMSGEPGSVSSGNY
jgi:hypothetical protein